MIRKHAFSLFLWLDFGWLKDKVVNKKTIEDYGTKLLDFVIFNYPFIQQLLLHHWQSYPLLSYQMLYKNDELLFIEDHPNW